MGERANLFMFVATRKEPFLGFSMMKEKTQLWSQKHGFYS